MQISINPKSSLLPPIILVLATCELNSVTINQQADGPSDPLLTLNDGTTVTGFKNVVIELVKRSDKHRSLLGANDADKKEVEKWLEFVSSIQPSDPKTWAHQLHKHNRTLLLQVFVVSNYLSIADIVFYAALHPIVSAWSEKERNIDGCITRWFDFVQHQTLVPKLLPHVEIKQDALPDERKPSTKPEPTTTTTTTTSTTETKGESSKPAESKKQEGGKNEKKQPSDKKEQGENKGEKKQGEKGEKGEKKQGNEKKEQGDNKGEKKQAEKGDKKEQGDKKEKKPQEPKKAPEAKKPTREGPPDVSWLEIRVGKILECSRHPDPAVKSLYVEQIDVGEAQPRTVVSGLVDFVPIDVMKGHRVALLCNLKPAKLRGVLSMAMVLAASTEDHKQVELVTPPEDAQIGERLYVEGFAGDFEKEIEKEAPI
eukprot:TRINITY_DN8035_c0_g1_i1.p1 TRINITY_DN8035_c0_g1~~TRINITY_DN8035_c0_g1_i1.p1  ORF type:complete len:451 (-),score=158.55 TRINITY_DN8035_c0_g1_i1:201-1478(-)